MTRSHFTETGTVWLPLTLSVNLACVVAVEGQIVWIGGGKFMCGSATRLAENRYFTAQIQRSAAETNRVLLGSPPPALR